jgi:hypothetical protein
MAWPWTVILGKTRCNPSRRNPPSCRRETRRVLGILSLVKRGWNTGEGSVGVTFPGRRRKNGEKTRSDALNEYLSQAVWATCGMFGAPWRSARNISSFPLKVGLRFSDGLTIIISV